MSTAPTPLANAQAQDASASEEPGEYYVPRVLIAEDNVINLRVLLAFLKIRLQLRCVIARNGLEALETFKNDAMTTDPPSEPFDYILMDQSMPVMDGPESTRQIRKFEAEHHLHRCTIIAATASVAGQNPRDAMDAGADDFIPKPMTFHSVQRIFEMTPCP